ncbi:MAG: DUF3822 family protein [Bacteroidetes bacterium]|nr:DUF3822 family protein [Bacteroidota bacterium]
MEDSSSDYFYVFNKKNGFYNEAVFAFDYELLGFVQTSAEGLILQDFQPIKHHCSSVTFLYTPNYFEIVPSVFKGAGLIDNRAMINETEIDFLGTKMMLRNDTSDIELPRRGQITEVSVTDLIIKLVSKSIIHLPCEFNLFVFRKENGFHQILLQKNRILFANSFDFIAYEEVLYFCLNTLKDYGIDQNECSLFYSEAEYSQSASTLWRSYFSQVIAFEQHFKLPYFRGDIAFELSEFSLLLELVKCV